MNICMSICMSICMGACMSVCMSVCMSACMRICTCICTSIPVSDVQQFHHLNWRNGPILYWKLRMTAQCALCLVDLGL